MQVGDDDVLGRRREERAHLVVDRVGGIEQLLRQDLGRVVVRGGVRVQLVRRCVLPLDEPRHCRSFGRSAQGPPPCRTTASCWRRLRSASSLPPQPTVRDGLWRRRCLGRQRCRREQRHRADNGCHEEGGARASGHVQVPAVLAVRRCAGTEVPETRLAMLARSRTHRHAFPGSVFVPPQAVIVGRWIAVHAVSNRQRSVPIEAVAAVSECLARVSGHDHDRRHDDRRVERCAGSPRAADVSVRTRSRVRRTSLRWC